VIGNAGDVWNMAASNNGSGTISSVLDTSGASTGVGLTYSATTQWNEHDPSSTYNDTAFSSTPYANLMGSYLVYTSPAGSLDITGLDPGGEYVMYFYTQANQNTNGRVADFNVNGAEVSTTQVNADTLSAFVLGQNYTVADVFANGSGDINVAITGSYEGDVNGFQLVGGGGSSPSAPEPATAGLMLLALGAGLLHRRRAAKR
jgi:hypothetical protein